MELVAQLMTPDPVVVEGGTPVAECAHLMASHGIRHLPVVDPGGRLEGVVTDWTVFQRGAAMRDDGWIAFDEGDQWLLARELAQPVEVVTRASERSGRMLHQLVRSFQDVAVVVDAQERPVGIVTEHDAVRMGSELLDERLWCTELPPRPLDLVAWDTPIRRVIGLMSHGASRHLLVTCGEALRGVLSFRDIAREASLGVDVRASDLVRRSPPEYAVGAVSLRYAAQVMLAQRIGCLPVVDRDLRPQRLLTRTDIARCLVGQLQPEPAVEEPPPPPAWLTGVG